MEELVCKDCNSPAHVSVVFCDGTYGSKIQYCVICSNCKADTAIPQRFDTPEQAIAAWNRRVEGMKELKASDITQRTAVFSDECKKLDNMRDELLNGIFAHLLQGIVEHAKEIEKIKEEEEDAQSIGKKECCVQEEEQ